MPSKLIDLLCVYNLDRSYDRYNYVYDYYNELIKDESGLTDDFTGDYLVFNLKFKSMPFICYWMFIYGLLSDYRLYFIFLLVRIDALCILGLFVIILPGLLD